MANKATNISDLIQRVTSSCLLNPLSSSRHLTIPDSDSDNNLSPTKNNMVKSDSEYSEEEEDMFQDPQESFRITSRNVDLRNEKVVELEMLLGEVFEVVGKMKEAYVSLQEAHSPWDAAKMRVADVGMVAELRRLGVLRQRFRRSGGGRGKWRVGVSTLREVVAPYEATVEELKREVKEKDREIQELKEKVRSSAEGNGKKGSSSKSSRRKVSCSTQGSYLFLTKLYFVFK